MHNTGVIIACTGNFFYIVVVGGVPVGDVECSTALLGSPSDSFQVDFSTASQISQTRGKKRASRTKELDLPSFRPMLYIPIIMNTAEMILMKGMMASTAQKPCWPPISSIRQLL